VALPVGIQGPTAGVIIGPAIIASIVGEPGALAQVLALVAMGFVAYAFIVFTRAFNTAGSVYGFNAAALGPGYGFVSAWLLLLVYISFAAGVYAATADIAQTLLASLGLHVSWPAWRRQVLLAGRVIAGEVAALAVLGRLAVAAVARPGGPAPGRVSSAAGRAATGSSGTGSGAPGGTGIPRE
jgi:amino acid transporter